MTNGCCLRLGGPSPSWSAAIVHPWPPEDASSLTHKQMEKMKSKTVPIKCGCLSLRLIQTSSSKNRNNTCKSDHVIHNKQLHVHQIHPNPTLPRHNLLELGAFPWQLLLDVPCVENGPGWCSAGEIIRWSHPIEHPQGMRSQICVNPLVNQNFCGPPIWEWVKTM